MMLPIEMARYCGVSRDTIVYWREHGLNTADGVVKIERDDIIGLHSFLRKARAHPSVRKLRPGVLERALRNPAIEDTSLPRRFVVPPVPHLRSRW